MMNINESEPLKALTTSPVCQTHVLQQGGVLHEEFLFQSACLQLRGGRKKVMTQLTGFSNDGILMTFLHVVKLSFKSNVPPQR